MEKINERDKNILNSVCREDIASKMAFGQRPKRN